VALTQSTVRAVSGSFFAHSSDLRVRTSRGGSDHGSPRSVLGGGAGIPFARRSIRSSVATRHASASRIRLAVVVLNSDWKRPSVSREIDIRRARLSLNVYLQTLGFPLSLLVDFRSARRSKSSSARYSERARAGVKFRTVISVTGCSGKRTRPSAAVGRHDRDRINEFAPTLCPHSHATRIRVMEGLPSAIQ
jgi:hypothetical protein